MRASSEAALRQADLALFVVDARSGLTPADRAFAQWLRRQTVPVILVANKTEGRLGGHAAMEAYELGLGDPVPVSAEHGDGMGELHDAVREHSAAEESGGRARIRDDPDRPLRLAIIGRPNAGKSTLLNALLGEERMITGPEPGLTRDAVAVEWPTGPAARAAGGYRGAAQEGARSSRTRADVGRRLDRRAEGVRGGGAGARRAARHGRAGPAPRPAGGARGPRVVIALTSGMRSRTASAARRRVGTC